MAFNAYQNTASGNPTNTWVSPDLLMAADTVQVIDRNVKLQRVPKNKNETVTWLRAVTPDVDTTESAEGVSKASRALTYENATVTIQEFAESFAISSRQADMGERDVLADSKNRLVDLIRKTREVNGWLTFRNGNNVIYNSSAITSRVTVNGAPTLGRFRVASRFLKANKAKVHREATKGSVNYDTYAMEPAYLVWCHTDCQSDIRDLPGCIMAQKVGGGGEKIPELFAYVEDMAFVTSPEFEPRLAAGAAVGATGMKSVGGVSVDVYSYVIFVQEAFGRVSLAGSQSESGLGGVTFTVLKDADKSDRDNRLRIVGAQWHDGPVVLNQNWAITIEAGVTNNPA